MNRPRPRHLGRQGSALDFDSVHIVRRNTIISQRFPTVNGLQNWETNNGFSKQNSMEIEMPLVGAIHTVLRFRERGKRNRLPTSVFKNESGIRSIRHCVEEKTLTQIYPKDHFQKIKKFRIEKV